MMCLGNICGMRRVDRARNSLIGERRMCVECTEKNWEERVKMVRACGKNGGGKIG